MRLDGARGKKQVWRPMFEPEVFRKQMYCIEVLVTLTYGNFGLMKGKIFNSPNFCATVRKTNRKVLQGDKSAQTYREAFPDIF